MPAPPRSGQQQPRWPPVFASSFPPYRTETTAHEFTFQEALTDREIGVLNLIAEGLTNPEIARRLSISRNTVKFHVSSIIAKLGAASRTDAVTLGMKRGLIIV
jgi:DNA-binding NarL/FixJ family response regulator